MKSPMNIPTERPDSDDQALRCPVCEDQFLHHKCVHVFEPRREDAADGLAVAIEGPRFVVDTNLAGNPSSRRNGLCIAFWCEMCHAKPVLNIAQHKGVTEMW